ncbi:MAG: hypothetical protein ACRDOT_04550 [Aeromicrobium sp.]
MSTMVEESAIAHCDRFLEALQPWRMRPELAAVTGSRSTSCHVLDAKYEPGVRAVILYALGDQLVRGDLLPMPDGVRISPFPHDPDLPTLPLLMDPDTAGTLAGGFGRTRIDLLRYRPGKRATVRVTSGGTTVVAKAYHDRTKAAAVAEESVALADAARCAATLRFAPTAAHLDDLGWVVQHPVHGAPLDALVGNTRLCPSEAADGVRRAARALAELHATRPVLQRVRSVDKELNRFGLRAGRIATVDPHVGAQADQLATRLVAAEQHLPAASIGPVHGDCKPSQFLLAQHTVHLLDLDHCGMSDQAADVGTFMATLRQYAVRHTLAGRPTALTDRLPALAEEFLTAYLDAAGESTRSRIRWHEAVALERKALRSFARAPRSPVAAALIHEANRCLDRLAETA